VRDVRWDGDCCKALTELEGHIADACQLTVIRNRDDRQISAPIEGIIPDAFYTRWNCDRGECFVVLKRSTADFCHTLGNHKVRHWHTV